MRTLTLALVLSLAAVPGLRPGAAGAPTESTPAEQKIAAARTRIAKNPSRPDGHNDLAMALARRARESADPAFYAQAAAALEESRRLAPGNVEADRIEVWVLLGRHEFARALDQARELNRRVPDDLMTYGMIVDGSVEVGRYDVAEDAAQWMLNLRPGAVPGLTRAAYLREIFGDIEGSLELMGMALDQLPPRETEERAWVLTQISHLELVAGRIDRARQAAEGALRLFPKYHYALAALARVHERTGDHARAAALLAERYDVAPHPENLFALGEALARAGRTADAAARFREFESKAVAESASADNANRELALYYTDHANRPLDAVRIMEREMARRRDVGTLDMYAWSLFKAGRRDEARLLITQALAVGTLEPVIRRHAAAILGG